MKLADKKCSACVGATSALSGTESQRLLEELGSNWRVVEGHHLEKEWKFKNFVEALAFTNKIGEVAEAEGHHPGIFLTWGQVRVTIFTHKVNGLTESDFVMGAKIDQIK